MSIRGNHIPERVLQHIWQRQYLSAPLKTTDGKSVVVHFPGEMNDDGGPDFRHARISIGGTRYYGEIEIHRKAADWIHHAHHRDPKYNSVILHVVLHGETDRWPTVSQSGRRVPTVVFGSFLPESSKKLFERIVHEVQTDRRIPCSLYNESIDPGVMEHWIMTLARQRLETKVRVLEERLRELAREELQVSEPRGQFGVIEQEGSADEIPPPYRELSSSEISNRSVWDQLLYEGIMDGFGYSRNRKPFLRLAMSVTLGRVRAMRIERNETDLRAVLYGVAGLVPSETHLGEILRKRWEELRPSFQGDVLGKADWQFFPARPANLPATRILAAAAMIQRIILYDLFGSIVKSIASGRTNGEILKLLQKLFCVTIEGKRVLGLSRASDIIANTVIPICFLYARLYKRKDVREGARYLYEWFPPLSTNAILRLMEHQLLKQRLELSSMRLQQGVLQLYLYFCREERCRECEIGKVVFNDYIKRDHAGAP
ncbi:MAG: DUF2851 family protein [Ignavibacteriales bacterium]|nr:DUF2851 family protein [Ignavibacteriales bacterium]